MKKVISLMLLSSLTCFADSQELKVLGRTVIYENGSWVNPEEPKFKIKEPKTWAKRNYVRHYMQGSEDITDSIIEINWKGLVEASKTGNKIPMREFIKLFRFKKTVAAAKQHPEAVVVPVGIAAGSTHPEAAIVPVGMAVGSAAEGSKGTVMATVGLLKNTGELTLKLLKFIAKPLTKTVELQK